MHRIKIYTINCFINKMQLFCNMYKICKFNLHESYKRLIVKVPTVTILF